VGAVVEARPEDLEAVFIGNVSMKCLRTPWRKLTTSTAEERCHPCHTGTEHFSHVYPSLACSSLSTVHLVVSSDTRAKLTNTSSAYP
jgi:hypothetical protein